MKRGHLSCFTLLLVTFVTDQLTSVSGQNTGHSQQTRLDSDRNDNERMEGLMEEILNEIRHQKQQQQIAFNLLQLQQRELAEIRKEQYVEREMLSVLSDELRLVREQLNRTNQQLTEQQRDNQQLQQQKQCQQQVTIDETVAMTTTSQSLETSTRPTTRHILTARLNHTITPRPGQSDITGVATRSNKLYIGYHRPATIEIYDVSTFRLQRRLNVTGMTCIGDMASCPDCDVVFIADGCSPDKIHVTDDVGQLRTQWSVSDEPHGVSVNSQSNVIVTLHYARKLREYTPGGRLVREITLQSDIQYPEHAIQLDNDRYVVSHTGNQHRVCIVNGNGTVVQCYGGQRGSGVGQLYEPRHLALFGESLLVADTWNYRVLQLNVSSLTYIGELINTRNEGCLPSRLAMNEDDRSLYVAYDNNRNCPIKVFNLITE